MIGMDGERESQGNSVRTARLDDEKRFFKSFRKCLCGFVCGFVCVITTMCLLYGRFSNTSFNRHPPSHLGRPNILTTPSQWDKPPTSSVLNMKLNDLMIRHSS